MHVRSVGATGLKVSRLGLGTMTWGRDTDEHEARDQLIAFAEAGGTLLDTAAGYGDGASEELIGSLIGDVVARDEVVIATKAGISRRTGSRVTDASRGHPAHARSTRRSQRLGVDHVDLWQVHTWVDDAPLEETLSALDTAVATRPGVVRRGLQLLRLADRAGGHLAARGARPGDARLDADGVLPAQPRASRTRCCPAAQALGLGVLPWSPLGRGVLTGKYRSRHARRLAGRLAALRGLRRRLPRRALPAGRRGRRHGRRGPRLDARSRWRWRGCATGRE